MCCAVLLVRSRALLGQVIRADVIRYDDAGRCVMMMWWGMIVVSMMMSMMCVDAEQVSIEANWITMKMMTASLNDGAWIRFVRVVCNLR